MKFGTREFLRLQITNLNSNFRNSKWRIQHGGEICLFGWISVLGNFQNRWLWIWTRNAEIQNSGSNTTNQISKIWLIRMKLGTGRFLGSQSKWRIQYGDPNCKKLAKSNETRYWKIFEVADYECKLEFQKLKMADPIWRPKLQKFD